jgi:hypothetical protein
MKMLTVPLKVPAFFFTTWFRLVALIGLALWGGASRLSVIQAQIAQPPPAFPTLAPGPNRNVFDGEPTYLPCGHLRVGLGSRSRGGVTRFSCDHGHLFRHDEWGWAFDNGAGADIPLR